MKAVLLMGVAGTALLVALLALRTDKSVTSLENSGPQGELPIARLPLAGEARTPTLVEPPATAYENAPRHPIPPGEDPIAPDRGALEVRLTWFDGSAAAGVGIAVRCTADPAPREELFFGRSDAHGVVRLSALFAGHVNIFHERHHHVHQAQVVAGQTEAVTIRIPEGFSVRGRVETPGGEPVAGAQIWLESSHHYYPRAELVVHTDFEGLFSLEHLGPRARLGARADGWEPSVFFEAAKLPVEASERTITLTLGEAGGSVRGRVIDPDGEPVAGATVLIGKSGGHSVDLPTGMRGTAPEPVRVRTGADGTFVYPGGLPGGRLPLHVSARDHPIHSGSVEVTLGGPTEVEIQLAAPAAIEGRVFHADGRPAAGAYLVVAREHDGGWYSISLPVPRATADEEGQFKLDWVPPGIAEVNASLSSDARAGRGRAELLVCEGEEHHLELSLSLGKTITGTVVNTGGDPLIGWGVWAEPSPRGAVYPRHDTTDEQGRFLLANLCDSRQELDILFDVQVAAPDEVPIPPRAERKSVAPGTDGLVVVVENSAIADAGIRGVLCDADGTVPTDLELICIPYPGLVGSFVDYDPANGIFSYGPVIPGRFRMTVARGNGSRTVAETPWFEVDSGEIHDVGTIRIEPQGRVEVAIPWQEGRPESIELHLDREGCGTEELNLEDGVHRSRDLLPGTWILQSWHRGSWGIRPQSIEVTSALTVRVHAEWVRQVRVPFAFRIEGAQDGWSTFKLRIHDESAGWTITRQYNPRRFDRGPARMKLAIPEGICRIVAELDDGRRAEVEIEVDPSAPPAEPYELVLR